MLSKIYHLVGMSSAILHPIYRFIETRVFKRGSGEENPRMGSDRFSYYENDEGDVLDRLIEAEVENAILKSICK